MGLRTRMKIRMRGKEKIVRKTNRKISYARKRSKEYPFKYKIIKVKRLFVNHKIYLKII